jgi:fibronectin-binding autotransporter adhesin
VTTTVVNTYIQDVTQSLTGNLDDLLVTSAGSLVETEGEDGIDSTGAADAITVDGLVYSADSGTGTAVSITGAATHLFVNGQVQGDTGVSVENTTSVSVNVGSQGSIESVSGGAAANFQGNSSSPLATDYTLDNAGDIFGGYGVFFADGGGDVINNTGQISGSFAVSFSSNVATETVENSGTIEGGAGSDASAIRSEESSAGVAIVNSGLITDGAANASSGPYALLYFDDNSGTTSTIDNEGTITGEGFVIRSASDVLGIINSGTIHGSVYSTNSVHADNSGNWHHGTGTGFLTFLSTGADNSLTNAQAGTITGGISMEGSGDTIDNAGRITGSLTLAAGSDTVTNEGELDGSVTFTGSGAANTFTNSGSIAGNVTLAGGTTATNTGTINGNLTLGATDTVDASRGVVDGAIAASTSDTFDYHGLFGEQTIDNFTAGTSSTHDTIQFAANDFGSFSAVQSATSQVGSDTVIRLDSADSITLVGVTAASLVSANFSFV